MRDQHWQHFPHDADVGIRGFGNTVAEAYEQAARAMIAAITDPESVDPSQQVPIVCEAPDHELLLVDWLNALVYEMATRHMLFSKFEVSIEGTRLIATAWGEEVNTEKHRPAVEVKGATHTHLRVHQRPNGDWVAECVIDV
jgi:tRNA nucleotidyltransferase (CCA-adding enzyme)